jgi:hypothetical protein
MSTNDNDKTIDAMLTPSTVEHHAWQELCDRLPAVAQLVTPERLNNARGHTIGQDTIDRAIDWADDEISRWVSDLDPIDFSGIRHLEVQLMETMHALKSPTFWLEATDPTAFRAELHQLAHRQFGALLVAIG